MNQPTPVGPSDALDRRDRAWYVDSIAKALVFTGGISAIIFILGIFVFITVQGLDFIFGRFEFTASRRRTR